MSSISAASPGLLQQRPFVLLWLARVFSTVGYYMLALTIGWQIYELTDSALDLGLIGLIQFVPAVVLTLLIGHAADRYDRRLIVRGTYALYAFTAVAIAGALLTHTLSRELLLGAVFLIGCGRAFELPTAHALVPVVVPPPLLARAVASWTSANQVATICGPALGGLIYAVSPLAVGIVCVVFFITAIVCMTLVRVDRPPVPREPPTLASVFAGFTYIRQSRRLLGVISLDLFVILLGGATALMPIFARDILEVGPVGLGLLRSAPGVGALVTAVVLSNHPIERHVGPALFAVVTIFGVATIVFALSTSFLLSLAALAVLGASDAVSVVIRFTLVQLETPDEKRGRVTAINSLFVSSSNTLGEFRAGVTADWFGAVASTLIGGVGSLLIAGLWMLWFPDLRRIDRFKAADRGENNA
jgi:MFS family permease